MSKIDRVLAFAFNHQLVIIELIFAVIMAIAAVWLFHSLRGDSGEANEGVKLNDVEQALKRVLESADFKVTAAQAVQLIKDDEDPMAPLISKGGATGGKPGVTSAGAADPAELARLRAEMDAKNKKMNEIEQALGQAKAELSKAQAVQAAGGTSAGGGEGGAGVNTDALQAKIKSLESRLAEYEIIEDDIANLSLYKEENLKLKAELDRLKKGEAPLAAAAPTVSTASAPASPTPSAPSAATPIDSDKLLKEFDALVAQDTSKDIPKSVTPAPAPAPAAPTTPPPAAAPAAASAAQPAAGENKDGGEKLIEEFENFVKGSQT